MVYLRLKNITKQFGGFITNDNINIVEYLPVGIQQRIEILKLLYRQAKLLILDEPTAVLTPLQAQ